MPTVADCPFVEESFVSSGIFVHLSSICLALASRFAPTANIFRDLGRFLGRYGISIGIECRVALLLGVARVFAS